MSLYYLAIMIGLRTVLCKGRYRQACLVTDRTSPMTTV